MLSRRSFLGGSSEIKRVAAEPRESWRESWYVGEKIQCVNNGFLALADAPELTVGATYTIAAIWPKRREYYGLELAEVNAKAVFVAFDERRFRPLLAS